MLVTTTYLNNNDQTPLGRFVVSTNFATHMVTNRTDGP